MHLQIAMPPTDIIWARCRAALEPACLTYSQQICHNTPSFVFALQRHISGQDYLRCSSTDEWILLVVVFVRGMRVYPVYGLFSLQITICVSPASRQNQSRRCLCVDIYQLTSFCQSSQSTCKVNSRLFLWLYQQ